jgi:hypothetical protein
LFICDECVALCIDVIEPELAEDNLELFRLMSANEESGVADDPALLELARRASAEVLAQRKLAERRSNAPLDHKQGTIGGRAALKRYEDVLSHATTVLGERRQSLPANSWIVHAARDFIGHRGVDSRRGRAQLYGRVDTPAACALLGW